MVRKDWPGDFVGLVLLFDMEDNRLKAILHDHYLSPIRVAATSALVAKHLARHGGSVMGLFGSGEQAKAHVLGLAEVEEIDLIKVFSPNRIHREAFAKDTESELGVEVRVVGRPKDVVEDSDLIVCATNSNEPVFDGRWLEPGTHIVTIVSSYRQVKQRETDDVTAKRADLVVVNSKEQIKLDGQIELLSLLETGVLSWQKMYEVTDLFLRETLGRTSGEQITVHYNNVGMGIQFAALGAVIYQKAREKGIGTQIPAELFLTKKGRSVWSP